MKLAELVTDDSNTVLEFRLVAASTCLVVGIVLKIYCVIKHIPFNFMDYATGCGALIMLVDLGKRLGSVPDNQGDKQENT